MTRLLLGHLYRKPFTPFCITDLYRNTPCASNLRSDYDGISDNLRTDQLSWSVSGLNI